MNRFKYESIDLKDCTFCLIQLAAGDEGPIQCNMFDARLDGEDRPIEYDALSYTWGGSEKPYEVEVEVDGMKMSITKNFLLALRQLRYKD